MARTTTAIVAVVLVSLAAGGGVKAAGVNLLDDDAVRVLYPDGRGGVAGRVAAASPGLFGALEEATGLPFDFRPVVVLAADGRAFAQMGGRDAVVAFAEPLRQRLVMDLSRFDTRPASFLPVLKHEYAHLLLHRHIASNLLPRWLDEGIAQHLSDGLSEYLPGPAQRLLGEALAADRVYPLVALETRFPAGAAGLQLAYEQSRSVVGYMVRRFGDAFLTALVARMAGGSTAEAAFRAVSGTSLAAFEADWRRQQTTPWAWLGRVAGHVYGILFFLAGVATLLGFLRYHRRRRAYADAEDDDPA